MFILDKDGTLLDFHATWDAAVAAAFGVIDEQVRQEAADNFGFDLAGGRILPDASFIAGTVDDMRLLLEPYVDMAVFVDAMVAASEATLTAMEGAHSLIADLRFRGIPMAVATNDNAEIAASQMAQLGWSDDMAAVIGANSGHGAKPGPGMVVAAAAACGVDPTQAVMVGDSSHDLLAARAAGALAVQIGDDPKAAPHAHVRIASLAEVAALVSTDGI